MPTFPANALQLNNEMLDFVFGYSTKRVSPYNQAPYEGFIAAAVEADGVRAPDGYLPTTYKAVGDLPSDYREWLVVSDDGLSFMLWDDAKLGYLPFDYGVYGPPVFRPLVSGISEGEAGTRYVNGYFDPIGRATTDRFPEPLSDGETPIKTFTETLAIPGNPSAFGAGIIGLPHFTQPSDYDSPHSNVSVIDLNGVVLTEIQTFNFASLNQYRAILNPGTNGIFYYFNAANAGRVCRFSYKYNATFPPVLAGAVVPDEEDDPAVDETAAGAPPTTSPFIWTNTTPGSVPSALADAFIVDLPIVIPGTGWDLNRIFNIAGGTGQGYVAEIDGDIPTKCKMWASGSGYTDGTKATTCSQFKAFQTGSQGAGTGIDLTVAVTIVGASPERPVLLDNPDGPDTWDLVNGGRMASLSMRHVSSGKRYLVPASNENANPATGPLNLTFPMSTVDTDNPTMAAIIRGIGIDPTGQSGNKVAFGYSVEDNAWSILELRGRSASFCSVLLYTRAACLIGPVTTLGGQQFFAGCYECRFEWTVERVLKGGFPGCSSETDSSNVSQSVVDLAADMEAEGVPADELPALANVLASSIIGSPRPWFWPDSWEWPIGSSGGSVPPVILGVGPPAGLAAAALATAAQAMRTLSTARAANQLAEVYDDIGAGVLKYFPRITPAQAMANFERTIGVTVLDGRLLMDVWRWIPYADPVPGLPTGEYGIVSTPVILLKPTASLPVTAANGFYNPFEGLDALAINDETNPLGQDYWNPLNAYLNKLLPNGPPENSCWYFGTGPNYNALPMVVHTPGLAAPGPAPVGKFDTSTNTMIMGRFPPDFNMRAHVCP